MLKCCSCSASQPVLILCQYLFTNPPFKVVLTLMDDAIPDHSVSSVTYCQHVRGFLKTLLASLPPLLCHGLSSLIQRNEFPLLSCCNSLVANSMKPNIYRCYYKWLLFCTRSSCGQLLDNQEGTEILSSLEVFLQSRLLLFSE